MEFGSLIMEKSIETAKASTMQRQFMSAPVFRCNRLCFLLVPLLLCSDLIQPIHSQAVVDHDLLGARGGGRGEAGTAERFTPAGGKPTARVAAGSGSSTVSTASSSSSSSLGSLWNDWVKQPAKKLYKKTKPLVLDLVKKDVDDDLDLQRPVEQYEILGMWRLSLNEGDDIAFLEIRPHDLSYGKKHRVAKYTFQPAKTAADKLLGGGGGGGEHVPAADDDDKKKDSSSSSKRAKTKRAAAKIANKIAPVSSTIRFEQDNRVYIAKLTRRRIDVEEEEDEDKSSKNRKGQPQKKKTVLKITGRIMENKHSSWWWPKRKLGTFAGIKLAYRELSREQAQIWDGKGEEPDITVTKDASSSSVITDADDWDQDVDEL